MPYDFGAIEPKWQKEWAESKVFEVEADSSKENFACLEMFPYPAERSHGALTQLFNWGSFGEIPPDAGI